MQVYKDYLNKNKGLFEDIEQSLSLQRLPEADAEKLKQFDDIISSKVYAYLPETGQFEIYPLRLKQNLLIMDRAGQLYYLYLNETYLQRKKIQQANITAYALVITNLLGSLYLVLNQQALFTSWYNELKKCCISMHFASKFALQDQFMPNTHTCIKTKVPSTPPIL